MSRSKVGLQIHLHIGAHKTATTFIQSQLRISAAGLRAAGVVAASHPDIRKTVSERLDLAAKLGSAATPLSQPALTKALKPFLEVPDGVRRLIISEENLAGPMASVGGGAGMYPDVGLRVKCLLAGLAGHEVRVFVSVRGYAEFLSSVYAFQAGRKPSLDIASFIARTAALRRDWRSVVQDVCDAAGPDAVTVWTYEGFKRDPALVSDALTGERGLDLFPANGRRVLPSLTRKGMAVLERVSPLLSSVERKRMSRVLSHFTFDQPDGKFEIFDAAQAEDLSARYFADLAAIERLGCAVVGAGQAAEALGSGA